MWHQTKREVLEMLPLVALGLQYGALLMIPAVIIDERPGLLGALAITAGGVAVSALACAYRWWRSNREHVYYIGLEDLY